MAKKLIREYKSKDGYTIFRDYAKYTTKKGDKKKTIYKNGKPTC